MLVDGSGLVVLPLLLSSVALEVVGTVGADGSASVGVVAVPEVVGHAAVTELVSAPSVSDVLLSPSLSAGFGVQPMSSTEEARTRKYAYIAYSRAAPGGNGPWADIGSRATIIAVRGPG